MTMKPQQTTRTQPAYWKSNEEIALLLTFRKSRTSDGQRAGDASRDESRSCLRNLAARAALVTALNRQPLASSGVLTMSRPKFDLKLSPETKLERHVARWLRAQARDSYDGEIRGVARDVMHGGCASGTVGHLIYTRDCVSFYRAHRADIEALVAGMCDDMGTDGPAGLFGDKWEKSDPFARDDANRNLLAWFGFEEACRALVSRAGYHL
jgi:hypothetical protein